jgi:hypothetical protein
VTARTRSGTALRRILAALATGATLAAGVAGCTVYQVAPGVYSPTPPGAFDRSWEAARLALLDQGVQVSLEDRAAGLIVGRRGGIDLTASVRTQADGSVRVQFDTKGATAQDPGLIDRVSRSYDARMGR